jgi:hypothetical protein
MHDNYISVTPLNLALRLKPAAAARRLEAFKVVGAFLGVCIRLNVEAGLFISAASLLLRSTVHTPQCHGRTWIQPWPSELLCTSPQHCLKLSDYYCHLGYT